MKRLFTDRRRSEEKPKERLCEKNPTAPDIVTNKKRVPDFMNKRWWSSRHECRRTSMSLGEPGGLSLHITTVGMRTDGLLLGRSAALV